MARRNRRRSLPEPFTATIEGMSHEGRGVCHHNGKVVFVFGALPGEVVRVQVQKSNKNFAEGSVLEVVEAADARVEPHCPNFGVCGGCSMQHLTRDDQLEFKHQSVAEMVAHAGIEVGQWLAPLTDQTWGYRRKARLGVRYVRKKGRVLVGFRERNKSYLADMQQCPVLIPQVGEHLQDLANLIEQLEARESIAQIEVAADDHHCMLILRHLEALSEHDLSKLQQFAVDSGLWLQLQPGGPATAKPFYPPQQQLTLHPLADETIEIRFDAGDFTQVNAGINQQMVQQALDYLDLQPQDRVLDLFCGLGNFTLPMARRAAEVIGVEGDQAMGDRARGNAIANDLHNTRYQVADLANVAGDEAWLKQRFDKILLDPPRSGAYEILPYLAAMQARTIVYVSCQPSSLVRDAAGLCEQGYKLSHLGLMDMFPHTAHVESMAVFHNN